MPTILCSNSNLCTEIQPPSLGADGVYRTEWQQQNTGIVIIDAHVTGNPYWEPTPSKPVADVLYTAPPENPPTTWPTPVPPFTTPVTPIVTTPGTTIVGTPDTPTTSPVPEPSTAMMLMIACALCGLGMKFRRAR